MNETIEEKKKILNTYGAAVRKYHALKNQEKHLRMIINRPRAAVLSGMPSSNKHKDISDIMIKLDDTLRMVKAAENANQTDAPPFFTKYSHIGILRRKRC